MSDPTATRTPAFSIATILWVGALAGLAMAAASQLSLTLAVSRRRADGRGTPPPP